MGRSRSILYGAVCLVASLAGCAGTNQSLVDKGAVGERSFPGARVVSGWRSRSAPDAPAWSTSRPVAEMASAASPASPTTAGEAAAPATADANPPASQPASTLAVTNQTPAGLNRYFPMLNRQGSTASRREDMVRPATGDLWAEATREKMRERLARARQVEAERARTVAESAEPASASGSGSESAEPVLPVALQVGPGTERPEGRPRVDAVPRVQQSPLPSAAPAEDATLPDWAKPSAALPRSMPGRVRGPLSSPEVVPAGATLEEPPAAMRTPAVERVAARRVADATEPDQVPATVRPLSPPLPSPSPESVPSELVLPSSPDALSTPAGAPVPAVRHTPEPAAEPIVTPLETASQNAPAPAPRVDTPEPPAPVPVPVPRPNTPEPPTAPEPPAAPVAPEPTSAKPRSAAPKVEEPPVPAPAPPEPTPPPPSEPPAPDVSLPKPDVKEAPAPSAEPPASRQAAPASPAPQLPAAQAPELAPQAAAPTPQATPYATPQKSAPAVSFPRVIPTLSRVVKPLPSGQSMVKECRFDRINAARSWWSTKWENCWLVNWCKEKKAHATGLVTASPQGNPAPVKPSPQSRKPAPAPAPSPQAPPKVTPVAKPAPAPSPQAPKKASPQTVPGWKTHADRNPSSQLPPGYAYPVAYYGGVTSPAATLANPQRPEPTVPAYSYWSTPTDPASVAASHAPKHSGLFSRLKERFQGLGHCDQDGCRCNCHGAHATPQSGPAPAPSGQSPAK